MNAAANTAPDRTKFIGGSDAAVVLGISPWRTRLQLWQDKVQPRVEKIDPARQRILSRGHRLEPYVVDMLAEETGLEVLHRNCRYIDAEHPFLACEIDAEAATGQNIEIKTVSPFKAQEWGELGTDAIPVHYTAQAQHGMMIRGAASCIFGVLIGGDDFRVYEVQRDDEIIAALREAEVRFWLDHVVPAVAPEPTSGEDIARLYPHDAGTAVEADTAALIAYNELRALLAQAKDLDAQIELRKDALRTAMGPHARLLSSGTELATWKTQQANRFDQSAFKAAQPDLYAQFVKTTEMRVLRIR